MLEINIRIMNTRTFLLNLAECVCVCVFQCGVNQFTPRILLRNVPGKHHVAALSSLPQDVSGLASPAPHSLPVMRDLFMPCQGSGNEKMHEAQSRLRRSLASELLLRDGHYLQGLPPDRFYDLVSILKE